MRRLVVALVLTVLAGMPIAAQQIPPNADWLTLETANFRVHFPAGLEEIARRAGVRAERAHALLADVFVRPPTGRIDLVLIDNVDMANGSATVLPRNRIIAFVHPPANEPHLAFHDDWLELLILHELVHVFQLENAGGVWSPLRNVFGRNPLLYPQFLTPAWVIEGLATYIESAQTDGGRVRGSTFDMILRTAAIENAFFGIDRVTVDPIVWPAGTTRYVYGGFFVDFLADRYGKEAVAAFVERLGRQTVPYRLDTAARAAFGETLTSSWSVWTDGLRREYAAVADTLRSRGLTEPEEVTAEGRYASHPRYAPDGEKIAYVSAPGRQEAAITILDSAARRNSIAPTSALGPPSWTPDGATIVYAQLEFASPYDVHSDLYLANVDGSGSRRLTRGARVWEPDVNPDGDRIAVVAREGGTNVLALYRRSSGIIESLTKPDLDVYWSAPRWSPDGNHLAAVRWKDGDLDVVVLDTVGRIDHVVSRDRALDVDPAWSPDGRFLIFSSDRTGVANLFAWDRETGKVLQVTNVLTGAFQPDVSRGGDWIIFSHYRSDGYHIARIAYDPSSWRAPDPARSLASPGSSESETDSESEIRGYSAMETLAPTYWTPHFVHYDDLGFGMGFQTEGGDVVGRHLWTTKLLRYWDGGRMDGALAYRYRGLGNPILDVSTSQEWRVQRAGQVVGGVEEAALLRRDREVDAGLTWLRRRWRSLAWVGTGADLRKFEFSWRGPSGEQAEAPPSLPLEGGTRLDLGFTTVRAFGVSLGAQEGLEVSNRLEARRPFGSVDPGASSAIYWRNRSRTLLFNGFDLFGFAPSVLAIRVDAGIESSTTAVGFTVGGGGGDGQVATGDSGLLRGRTALPIRGYPEGTQGGNRAVSGTIEFRYPIALVERGIRTLPIAVDRLWGNVFADVGSAWCAGSCPAQGDRVATSPSALVSIGAEAILQLRIGYTGTLPLRFGVAFPLDRPVSTSPSLYLRLDRSF